MSFYRYRYIFFIHTTALYRYSLHRYLVPCFDSFVEPWDMNDTNAEFVFLSNTGNYRYLSLHAVVADTKWQMTHVQMISGLLKSKCDPSHFVPSQTYVVCHPHKYEFLLNISIMSCSETKFVCRDKTLVPQSLVALHKNDLNESQNKAEHNRKNTFIVADSNFTSFHIFLSQSTTTTTLSKSLFMHTHTHTHTLQ